MIYKILKEYKDKIPHCSNIEYLTYLHFINCTIVSNTCLALYCQQFPPNSPFHFNIYSWTNETASLSHVATLMQRLHSWRVISVGF